MEQPRIRGGDQIPAERVKIGGEDMRRVKALAREVAPVSLLENVGIDLPFPEDRKALALCVILQAGKINKRLFPRGLVGGLNGFNQIAATTNLYDLARRRQ